MNPRLPTPVSSLNSIAAGVCREPAAPGVRSISAWEPEAVSPLREEAVRRAALQPLGPAQWLAGAIEARTARVGVVGLGYVGLPLAVSFADAGFPVTGFDLDEDRVAALRAGRSPIACVSDDAVAAERDAGRLDSSSDLAGLAETDVIIICVPTPWLDGSPDQSAVVAAAETIASTLRRGQLVVLESTVYPETTEGVVAPILGESGLALERDYFLAFSPERVDPGSGLAVGRIPKLVAGIGPASHSLASGMYSTIVGDVISVSSPRVAEFAKLLENSFRAVNIALVNEMAMLAGRIQVDIWEAIHAAATKPFGYMPFYPGPGVGGHCIAVDPQYLEWKARRAGLTLVTLEAARSVNERMPRYTTERIAEAVGGLVGRRILAFGVTFKRDVDDCRNSPAIDVIAELLRSGADVRFHDPFVGEIVVAGRRLARVESWRSEARMADAVVVLVDHSSYPWTEIGRAARLVFDARGVLPPGSGVHRL